MATASSSTKECVAALAAAPNLLLGFDFDGTLAPEAAVAVDAISSDTGWTTLFPEAAAVLSALVGMEHVRVVVISGRRRADLLGRMAGLDGAETIGLHGLERADMPMPEAVVQFGQELAPIRTAASEFVSRWPGCVIADKEFSWTFMVSEVAEELQDEALIAIESWSYRNLPRGRFHRQKRMFEIRPPVETDKGSAFLDLARSGETLFYAGDDVTDEDVFAVLGSDDWGARLGEGETAARLRLRDPAALCRLLTDLTETLSSA